MGEIAMAQLDLDSFDRALLELVQRDASLTHEAMGEQISLSASSVRRRLQRLKEAGVIEREVALLSRDHAGVTLIVSIAFAHETPEAYDALDRRLQNADPVKQVYHVAGEEDYVLIVHCASLQAYEAWARDALMSDTAIRRYSTRVVWSCKKFDTGVDV